MECWEGLSRLRPLTIINDILDFSKVEAGKLELERMRFDLRQTVADAIDLFVEQARSKNITLVHVVSGSFPSVFEGDPVRLRQILINLVDNAVKFTERGEVAVTISASDETETHATLRCEVRDTGIGIDPAVQSKIFDAFSQGDGSTTRKYGGTGLGLSIVKQLVSLMGGAIGVTSVPGQGATFWFTAQLAKVSDGSTREGGTASTLLRVGHPVETMPSRRRVQLLGRRVLLAEDNPVNREVASSMLEQLGCQVVAVEHGRDAVTETERARFDVVVMDCQMPEMDGFSATRAIRDGERHTGGHVPIVALAAHAIDSVRE